MPEEQRCTVDRTDGSVSPAQFLQRYGRLRAGGGGGRQPGERGGPGALAVGGGAQLPVPAGDPPRSRCSLPGSPSPGPSSSAGSPTTR